MTIARFCAKSLLVLQTAVALTAAVIYDGGPPNPGLSVNMSTLVAAQQFTLTNATTLQGLMFFSTTPPNLPSQFGGTIGFRILLDNAGAPGTSQALGSDSTVRLINDGPQSGFAVNQYRVLVNLGSIPLGAGTYWLALHEGTMGSALDGTVIVWNTTTSAPAGAANLQLTSDLSGLSGYTSLNGIKLAFQLLDAPAYNAVPEPSTWVLMLSAGGFLLLRRRR